MAAVMVVPAAASAQTAPPGRAYEQVSPVQKNGNDVASSANGVVPTIQASLDGSRIAYGSTGGFADTPSVLVRTYYSSHRGADWTTSSLMPAWAITHVSGHTTSVMSVSPDGTRAVVGSHAALAPGAVQGNANYYMRDNATGALTLMLSAGPGSFDTGWFGNEDFSRVAFASFSKLTPDATAQRNAYTWAATSGVELVTKLSDGTAVDGWLTGGSGGIETRRPGFVSRDGSRVFFQDIASRTVRVWEDGQTRLISQNPGEDLLQASQDGSKVLTTTAISTFGELNVYDVDSGEITSTVDSPSGELLFWANADDLSRVYFASGGNIYLWDGGSLVAIAEVDDPNVAINSAVPYTDTDGKILVFNSALPLTGYDNGNPACRGTGLIGTTTGSCTQVFVYDAVADELACASCPDDGRSPGGHANVGGMALITAQTLNYFARSVLDDGRVFFDSPEALVPEDTNGRVDAYQWLDGEVSLISTGRGETDSRFADASVDGRDLFFVTGDRLVGQDTDNLADLYDARLGGGIASQNPSRPKQPCTGDGCQGGVTAGRGGETLGSLAHSGPRDRERASGAAVLRVAVGSRLRVSKAGVVGVKVRVRGAGRVVARVSAKVGGRRVAVGSARANARAGSLRLALRLNKAGRRSLAEHGRLAVRIVVSGTGGKARRASVLLIGGRR